MPVNIKDLTMDELTEYFLGAGEPKFRAKQCFSWLHKGVTSFDEMTNLSKKLKEKLSESFFISVPEIARKQVSSDGTIKYLYKNFDGTFTESVIMQYHHGVSACISTQVGCNMGCKFCASTIGGKERDLTAGEILDQIIFSEKDTGMRISNIVLMGMGEPLDNYDNVIKFLKNVNHPDGLNIGYRHISLSTCGLVDKINRLAEENFPITLSISLHATNDKTRSEIMPVNKKYNIEQLIGCVKNYIKKTGRRVSFEYTLISGVNDKEENARELASLLKGMLCHVNLIPVNSVAESGFSKPENPNRFKELLIKLGVNATVRRELGSDIDAACGQLRRKNTQKN